MDVTVKKDQEKSQVELKITVTAEEFEPYLIEAAKTISKDHPIKGFRPGKVTLSVAFESYGQEKIVNEALQRAVPRFFVQAVLDNDLEALGQPTTSIDTADPEKGLMFTATVDIMPEVALGDPTKITATKKVSEVTDDVLDQELKMLAKTRSTYLEVARPAQKGDTVTVDFEVSMDGKVMDGGESKNHPVHIGEGHFVPDFENKIIGIQPGDEREFTISFPEDFGNKELQGKEALARVKAHSVQKRVIPELNDEFARSVGKFTDLAQLKEELKKNMNVDRAQREKERLQGELAEQLAESSTFSQIPESLVHREVDRRIEEFAQMLGMQQKTINDYLAEQNKTMADIRSDMREAAVKTIKVSLSLRQFAKEQKIEPSEEEIEKRMQQYLQRFKSLKDVPEDIDVEELKHSVSSTLRNNMALQKLEKLAQVSDEQPDASTEKKKTVS